MRLVEPFPKSILVIYTMEAAIAAVMEGSPLPPEFANNKEVVLAAVLYDGNHLRDALELQGDKDIVLAAVSKDGHALGYASIALRADEQIVLAAIKNDPEAFWNADPSLRNKKEFILQAFLMGDIFDYVDPTFYADKDVMMTAVLQNPLYLEYASDELKADREVVLAAILKDGNAIRLQPSRDPNLLYYASKRGYEPTPAEQQIIKETKDRFMTFMVAAKARRFTKTQRAEADPLQRLNAHGPHFAYLLKKKIGDFAGQPLKAGRRTRRFYKK